MATLYSNELKAVVVAGNFLDNPMSVLKENCYTVQHFNYNCEKKRNESGDVYGATNPVLLEFSIRVNSPGHTRHFFCGLVSNEHDYFSFLFNVTFNAGHRLDTYDDGMVIDGYIVSVDEEYGSNTVDQANGDSQMLLHVQILCRSVTYLGRDDHNFVSIFIQ